MKLLWSYKYLKVENATTNLSYRFYRCVPLTYLTAFKVIQLRPLAFLTSGWCWEAGRTGVIGPLLVEKTHGRARICLEARVSITTNTAGSLGDMVTTFAKFTSNSFFFLATPHGMQDLSSPTRDWTCAPLHWECRDLTNAPLGMFQGLQVKSCYYYYYYF